MPFNDSRTLVYCLGLTPDNRIHIGGGSAAYAWNDGVAGRPQAKAVELLRKELARLYPGLRSIEFETAWNGMVDMTLDWAPLVGVTGKQQNIYYGAGILRPRREPDVSFRQDYRGPGGRSRKGMA